MNIWLFQTGEPLPVSSSVRVMRTGHLANELAARGHSVTWWASQFNHYSKKWEDFGENNEVCLTNGVRIKAIRGIGYKKNISIRRFLDHSIVARKFRNAAANEKLPDVIVCALPEHRLAYAAYQFAKENQIPFVVDLRDRWPWDIVQLLPARLRWIGRLLLSYDFNIAKKTIAGASGLVTMMQSWQGWIQSEIGRAASPNDRTFFLGSGRPRPDAMMVRPPVKEALAQCADSWNILFVGAFNKNYWPQIAVDIADRLREKITASFPGEEERHKIRFILAGDGDYMEPLRKLIGNRPEFVLPGYVNEAEIYELMKLSKVALVTANGDFAAFPNKVFTYMSGSLPIVSNLGYEFAEMLVSKGVGFHFTNAEEAALDLLALYKNPEMQIHYAERSEVEFTQNYDSEKIYRDFADYIESFKS